MDPSAIPPLAGLDPADLLKQGAAEDTFLGSTAEPFNPPSIEELAPLFPQFEILEIIGQGGMGAVYKVRQKELERIVALKILPPSVGSTRGFPDRFMREAKALAKLNHPGIVTIHESGQRDGLFFIVMEFVDGVNLRQLMQTGRISPREALAIVPQICDALQFAHDKGIVHRDIKPENILLDRLGRVKVADFGIAKLIGADDAASGDFPTGGGVLLTEVGRVMGTPQYMAPEQLDRPEDVDHRADIYALGVVFYQMLTGELPAKKIEVPSSKVRIDVRLDEVVLHALAENPGLRYQTALDFRTAVDGLQVPPVQLPPPLRHADPGPQPQTGMFRRWWWLFLLMFPVGALLGVAVSLVSYQLIPKKYEAQAIVEVKNLAAQAPDPRFFATQFEVIKSRKLLGSVVDGLSLDQGWGVPKDVATGILSQSIQLQTIRGTDLIEIKTRLTDAGDAVTILNAVLEVYQSIKPGSIIVHESPVIPHEPVSPNKNLMMVVGTVGGLMISPLLALSLMGLFHGLSKLKPLPRRLILLGLAAVFVFGGLILFTLWGNPPKSPRASARMQISKQDSEEIPMVIPPTGDSPSAVDLSPPVEAVSAPRQCLITVFEDGSLSLDGEKITPEILLTELKRAVAIDPKLKVRVSGGAGVKYDKLVAVIDVCQTAGAVDLSFTSRSDESASGASKKSDLPSTRHFRIQKVLSEKTGATPMEYHRKMQDGTAAATEILLVSDFVLVSDEHVQSVSATLKDGKYSLTITIDSVGEAHLSEATLQGHGKDRLAILLGGEIMMAPVVTGRLGKTFIMENLDNTDELRRLLEALPKSEEDKATGIFPFLMKIDVADYGGSYQDLSGFVHSMAPLASWSGALEQFRKPLGAAVSRKLTGSQDLVDLPGMPKGEYRLMTFSSDFPDRAGVVETISFIREQDGTLKPAGYLFK